jgi:hypothetical protein
MAHLGNGWYRACTDTGGEVQSGYSLLQVCYLVTGTQPERQASEGFRGRIRGSRLMTYLLSEVFRES